MTIFRVDESEKDELMTLRIRIQRVMLIILLILLLPDAGVLAANNRGKPLKNIPDVFVSFNPGQETEYAVIVEMSTQTLFLYAYDGSYREIYRWASSTGDVSGAKFRSGDRKTPEGIYFFTMEHKKRDLAPIYGLGAFPTDYPNILDRFAGRDGNAIWLHGTNKTLKPRDTNGCIALVNSNLDELKKYIKLNRTPIIIVDKLSYASVDSVSETKKSILNFVSRWNDALSNGSYHDYLEFYDPDYLPDISWWPEWNKIRKSFQTSNEPISAEPKGISIFKHKGVYVVLFDQNVGSSAKDIYSSTKKFFLSFKGDQLRIIAEEYQAPPDKLKEYKKKNPFVVAIRNLESIRGGDREIEDLIEDWLEAWSSKNIKRYASYYSKDFRSQAGASLKAWVKYKNRLNRKYRFIRVSKDDLVVKKGRTKSTASFIQTYESNRFKNVSTKKLVFLREDGRWKIYRETAKERK